MEVDTLDIWTSRSIQTLGEIEMEKEELTKRELLIWWAGFMDGDGSISINKSKRKGHYYTGMVSITQHRKNIGPLFQVLEACKQNNLPIPNIREEAGLIIVMCWDGQQGAQTLLKLQPFFTRKNLIQKTEIYVKFFDPTKFGQHRKVEKDKLYEQFIPLKRKRGPQ